MTDNYKTNYKTKNDKLYDLPMPHYKAPKVGPSLDDICV